MKTPISFEIAKVLKEKGFDEPVLRGYYKLTFDDIWKPYFSRDGVSENLNCKEGLCSAPTIAEVVSWLYEKKGIWIEVRLSYKSDFVAVIKNPRVELEAKNSPTEAYLEAITYTLNNLL